VDVAKKRKAAQLVALELWQAYNIARDQVPGAVGSEFA
jgi:hypothetical protein